MNTPLDPIAFTLGPLSIRWYGIILGTAALFGLYLAIQEGKRFKINPDFFMDLVLIGVPSAIVGARIYYVAFKWDDYKENLWEIVKIWSGGIAIYGALIGAIVAGILYSRAKGYSFWRIADICAPSLIAGQMIGRWGNFINQEAHGGEVSEAFLRNTLHLPNFIVDQMNIKGIYYHPTFLYESIWNLAGLLLLFWLRRRPFVRAGELFAGYFIWYSIGRFFIEGLRTDSLAFDGPVWLVSLVEGLWAPMRIAFEPGEMAYGNVRISQLLSLLIAVAALVFIVVRRRKLGEQLPRYADPILSSKKVSDDEASAPEDEGETPDNEGAADDKNNSV